MKSFLSLVFASGALLLSAAQSHAHGGPPSALGIVAADSSGPRVVLLNEGLAFAHADGWSFACPQLWGDADTSAGKTPLASSIDGVETWVVGPGDLYVARDGRLSAQNRSDASSAAVLSLAADSDALFGLRIAGAGSEVFRIDAPSQPVLWMSETLWTSIAIDHGQLHLVRSRQDRKLELLTLDRSGQVLAQQSATVDVPLVQARLRPVAGRLFAVVNDGTQHALSVLNAGAWQSLHRTLGPIHGPQTSSDGAVWIAAGGELMRGTGDAFEPVDEARRVTCLEHWGALDYACVGSELHRLEPTGLGERLFSLHGLYGPDPARIPAAAARVCEFQWLLFKNDLERSGLEPREWPIPMPPPLQPVAKAPVVDTPEAVSQAPAGCSVRRSGPRAKHCWVSAAGGCGLLALGRALTRTRGAKPRHRGLV